MTRKRSVAPLGLVLALPLPTAYAVGYILGTAPRL